MWMEPTVRARPCANRRCTAPIGSSITPTAATISTATTKGAKTARGTDAGGFDWKGLNQATRFERSFQSGMTPLQAIRAGTSGPAELLGWGDKRGTTEAGKWADSVAVSGDPLNDIK